MNPRINESILKTLSYADVFDYPLTLEEIRIWLIDYRISNFEFRIKNIKLISMKQGYYFLRGRGNIVKERIKRNQWSGKKFIIADKAAKILRIIPTVKLIGITGALAMENAKKDDDIDFFIITSKRFLWTTRLLATILLEFTGKRRHPREQDVSNKICLNMFVAEDSLTLPKNEQDLFSAHEVMQMKPIFDKDNILKKFIRANRWVEKYLPNCFNIKYIDQRPISLWLKISNIFFNLLSFAFYPAELLLKYLQLWYMSKRRTKEVISDGRIRFHPHDARNWVMDKYRLRYLRAKRG